MPPKSSLTFSAETHGTLGVRNGGQVGQTDQAKGDVKQAGEKVKDAFKG